MQDDDNSIAGQISGAEALADVMSDLEARSQRFGSALTGALRNATVGGRGLESVLKGLGKQLIDIALSAALKPLQQLLGNAVSGVVGGITGGLSGGGATGAPGGFLKTVTPFADGGVVRSPSFFSMAGGSGGGGLGLMGEAGAEAILPLKRGPDGSLGVAAGGAGAGPSITFNVTATDAASFRKSEGQISAMLARSVGRGRRGL